MTHDHDSYTFDNGKSLRLLHGDVLVELDPTADRSQSGLIHFPDGAMEHVNQTGTIRALGYHVSKKTGARTPVLDEPLGTKCVFVRFRKDQHTNVQVRDLFDDNFILLKVADILVVYDAEDHGRVLA